MKSILGIINQSPVGNSSNHEAIEMLMVYAAFDYRVSLLLRGSAVLHLQKKQSPEALNIKDHNSLFTSLERYEIKHLFVDQKAMEEYQCSADESMLFDLVDSTTIADLIAEYSEVLNF